MAAHKNIQLVLDRAIIVLINNVNKVKIIGGAQSKFMKIMEDLNPLVKVRSPYLVHLIL
jgi:hypothetical protein